MVSNAPNGHILENLLLFSSFTKKKEWRVAGAWKVFPPVRTGVSNQAANDFHARVEGLLVTLRQYELQVEWHVDGDYSSLFGYYKQESLEAQAQGRLKRWA